MQKLIFLLSAFISFVGSLGAQTDNTLLDPNIAWAAEFDANFSLTEQTNFMDVRKILEADLVPYNNEHTFLSEKLFRAIRQEGKQAFKDGYLQTPLTGDLDSHCLSVLSELPAGKRDSLMADIRAGNITWLRAKQRYYLDKRSKTIRMKTLAVAPCVWVLAYTNYHTPVASELIPLFWVPVEDGDQSLKPNDLSYAVRFRGSNDLNAYSIPLGKTLKKIFEPSLMVYLFQEIPNKKYVAYEYDYRGDTLTPKTKRLTKKTFEELHTSIDTVTVFDPETYEERIEIVVNTLNPDDIRYIRVVQNWYWDERQNKLFIAPELFVFLYEQKDLYGNLQYNQPIFFLKPSR